MKLMASKKGLSNEAKSSHRSSIRARESSRSNDYTTIRNPRGRTVFGLEHHVGVGVIGVLGQVALDALDASRVLAFFACVHWHGPQPARLHRPEPDARRNQEAN